MTSVEDDGGLERDRAATPSEKGKAPLEEKRAAGELVRRM